MIPVGTLCYIVGEAEFFTFFRLSSGDTTEEWPIADLGRTCEVIAVPSRDCPGYVCDVEVGGERVAVQKWRCLRPITPPPVAEPAPALERDLEAVT